jgi:Tfp pilus assembly major pilin PilA
MAMMQVLHHSADSAGFDWVDVLVGLGVLAVLAAVGFAIYKVVQRRNAD